MDPDYENTREEDDILITCALRFDGYRYSADHEFDPMAALETIEQTGDLSSYTQSEHLALFFMLQRFLYKWGGEMLAPRSPQWRTFRELFFLCCRAPIPEPYRHGEYYTQWESTYAPRIGEIIARVRRNHERIQYLPKSDVHPSLKRAHKP